MARAASDTTKKAPPAPPRATDLEARVEGSGLVSAGAHPEFGKPTPLDKAVAGARSFVRTVGGLFAPHPPKPIGNSSADRHAQRAHEFDMSEATRKRMYAQMDSLTARRKREEKT